MMDGHRLKEQCAITSPLGEQDALKENRQKAVEFMRFAKAQKRKRALEGHALGLAAPAKDITLTVRPSIPEVEHMVLYKRSEERNSQAAHPHGDEAGGDGHCAEGFVEKRYLGNDVMTTSKDDDVVSTYRFPALRDKKSRM